MTLDTILMLVDQRFPRSTESVLLAHDIYKEQNNKLDTLLTMTKEEDLKVSPAEIISNEKIRPVETSLRAELDKEELDEYYESLDDDTPWVDPEDFAVM